MAAKDVQFKPLDFAGFPGENVGAPTADNNVTRVGVAAAPPAVAAVGSAGVEFEAARKDHTHQGVTSFNGASGAIVFAAGSALLQWGNDSIAAAADTRALAPGFSRNIADTIGGLPGGGTEGLYRASRAGTLRNLRVRHNSSTGNGNSVVYTVFVAGVATAITATLASGAIGDASDLANTAAVAAGDLLQVRASKAVSIGAGGVSVMVDLEFV